MTGEKTPRAILAGNIRALMLKREVSTRELARKSGVSHRTVAYILSQDVDTTIGKVAAIAKALNTTAWELCVPGLIDRLSREDDLGQMINDYPDAVPSARRYIDEIARREGLASRQQREEEAHGGRTPPDQP